MDSTLAGDRENELIEEVQVLKKQIDKLNKKVQMLSVDEDDAEQSDGDEIKQLRSQNTLLEQHQKETSRMVRDGTYRKLRFFHYFLRSMCILIFRIAQYSQKKCRIL